ncbi:hypothetical protein HC928_17745 [bacterium]|nr:hypothetical protein [bacterium]
MTHSEHLIIRAQPRSRIRVTLDDGQVLEGPTGASLGDFLNSPHLHYPAPLIAAICDGQLRELTYPVYRDANVSPVLLSSSDGGRIYRRSLVMLMTTAAAELWPGCQISVRYAVPDGGFYCTRLDAPALTPTELDRLAAFMRHLITADDPIEKRSVPLQEAIALFEQRGDADKVRLLEQRSRDSLTLYSLRGREDYYYGYMVASTRVLQHFRLIHAGEGFILQYPRKEHPTELRPLHSHAKLRSVFQQTDAWLSRMGVEDIGRLNRITREGRRLAELILVAEAFTSSMWPLSLVASAKHITHMAHRSC